MDDIRGLLLEIRENQQTLLSRLDNLESQVSTSKKDVKHRIEQLERKLLHGAANEVLRIPELVENILCNLDITDLPLLQQQSHFKNVIDGSLALQRKLFLAPDSETSIAKAELNPLIFNAKTADHTSVVFNKLAPALLESSALGWKRRNQLVLRDGDKSKGQNRRSDRLVGVSLLSLKNMLWVDGDGFQFLLQPLQLRNQSQKGLASECEMHGSWKKMLLVQPPQEIRWQYNDWVGSSGVIPAGTKMEDLVVDVTKLARR